jgi:trehalose/maltose hydrolase-like predicted phosphorylase
MDIHHSAWQGVHSGCLAGGWYAVFRGLMGIVTDNNGIKVNPKLFPFWNSVELNFVYHSKRINAKLIGNKLILNSGDDIDVPVIYHSKNFIFHDRLEMEIE